MKLEKRLGLVQSLPVSGCEEIGEAGLLEKERLMGQCGLMGRGRGLVSWNELMEGDGMVCRGMLM